VLGPEQRRERVDKVLARLLPDVSRATVQRWIEEGRVRVDGKPCRAKDSVTCGSQIELEAGPPPPSEADPDPSVELDVCYEDPHLLVVNKPAGLVVHPARGHRTGTLVERLAERPPHMHEVVDEPVGHLRTAHIAHEVHDHGQHFELMRIGIDDGMIDLCPNGTQPLVGIGDSRHLRPPLMTQDLGLGTVTPHFEP